MPKQEKQKFSVTRIIGKALNAVSKAEVPTNLTDDNGLMWIEPKQSHFGLVAMVEHSTILPQCVKAYRDNVAGFGLGVRYKDDEEETEEMSAEYLRLEAVLDQLNFETDTKEVFEDIVEAREIFGIAYLEVMRNPKGEVNQIEFIKDVATIRKSVPDTEHITASYHYRGEEIQRLKQFRSYRQEKNGKTVYFKEFGDPRIMDRETGKCVENIETHNQANEILEFSIGEGDYGTVRWIGQCLNVDGSRRAEALNNNYFKRGRHTPMMMVVSGGSISDDSKEALQSYMDDIEGERGQHGFMVLELEDTVTKAGFDGATQPNIEIKDMASMLQKDELFQAYLDNSRRKVQSAFRLPDLYVGYTTDFNRATAQTAQEITEEQVFMPQRKSLAWIINNKLLNEYNFKHVEVYFKAPDISNPDDMSKILTIAEKAGGMTPNLAHELALGAMGKISEDYDGEWGEIPLTVANAAKSETTTELSEEDTGKLQKSADHYADMVGVLRSVKAEICRRGDGE